MSDVQYLRRLNYLQAIFEKENCQVYVFEVLM